MTLSEEEIAGLLAALGPAPEAWVAAARELPRTRSELADVIGRIAADEAFRARVLADIDAVLGPAAEGSGAARDAVLRARLDLPE